MSVCFVTIYATPMKADMEFLTPNELSRVLKLHPFTVTRLAREKKIPGFKVGGVLRFPKNQFERWVGSKTGKRKHGKPTE